MPHESTKEKPSFLLFGVDCKSPTEATLLPAEPLTITSVNDYREQSMLSLSSARELALTHIQKAQKHYKKYYDLRANPKTCKLGDWVLVRFPHEESGKLRKLSRPWHGPYWIVCCNDTDVTVVKVNFPSEGTIQVHQMRVCPCPPQLPAGFYWYGENHSCPGRIPQQLHQILENPLPIVGEESSHVEDSNDQDDVDGEQDDIQEIDEQGLQDQQGKSELGDWGLDSLFDEYSGGVSGGQELQGPGLEQPPTVSAEKHYSLRDRSGVRHPRRFVQKIQDESHSRWGSDVTLVT